VGIKEKGGAEGPAYRTVPVGAIHADRGEEIVRKKKLTVVKLQTNRRWYIQQ